MQRGMCCTYVCLGKNWPPCRAWFFEHKWVTHVALLTQRMFVLVYGWFCVELLATVWNGL
jgi:hypothetical protein